MATASETDIPLKPGDLVKYVDHDHRVYRYTIYKVIDSGTILEIHHKGKKFYLVRSPEIKGWVKGPESRCLY